MNKNQQIEYISKKRLPHTVEVHARERASLYRCARRCIHTNNEIPYRPVNDIV